MENIANTTRNFINNNDTITVSDYPYGFKLRTTLYDSIEFNPKKGFRHVTQTINPKNGSLNKPKKGVYYPLMLRYFDENNHIKTVTMCSFGSIKAVKTLVQFLENYSQYFTSEMISYIVAELVGYIRVDMSAKVNYTSATLEDVKEYYLPFFKVLVEDVKNSTTNFMSYDIDSLIERFEK